MKDEPAGAKRKTDHKRENVPAAENEDEDEVFDITLPLPSPPLSPSERPRSRCHYTNVEMSPSSSKSREVVLREPVHFEERGLLFGNATNTSAKPGPTLEDVFDLGLNVAAKPKTTAKKPAKAKAPKAQVEDRIRIPHAGAPHVLAIAKALDGELCR